MLKRIVVIMVLAVAAACCIAMAPQAGQRTVTVALTGDILLDRGVRKYLDSEGVDYPYEKVRNILGGFDIVFGNLECPITEGGVPALKSWNLLFKADIENSYALRRAGYDVLNLANNHVMDYGPEGLLSTLDALEKSGIKAVGAGEDSEKARLPVYVEVKDIVVGFLGYSAFPHEGYFFFADRPDVAYADINRIGDEIRNARDNCDFLIVSFHWGREFDFYPYDHQRELAYLAADSGADVVVGHHPHVLQGIEEYNGSRIFYSLGNFVFDWQVPTGTDETVIVGLTLSGGSIREVELIPVQIKDCQPVLAQGDKAERILGWLQIED
jgi:poly-gamma-glutamate synthesis protein (capsule biosynthesis protein)